MSEPETSADDIAALDEAYRSFPTYADWTAHAVPAVEYWGEAVRGLEATKADVDEEQLQRAVDVATRAAAIDSGALESLYTTDRGVTFTVATQGAAWQTVLDERSASALALFEAQLNGYEGVLDIATERVPVNEAWIRHLHEVLCEPQETYRVITPQGAQDQPLSKGTYKTQPNHVMRSNDVPHAYAPVADTPPEMQRLVKELTSDRFRKSHPIHQASYAHYAFVVIHPFADGNGRVARALASAYMYRAAGVPLLVYADRKLEYFAALEASDQGQYTAFLRFVRDAGIGAIQLVLETLRTGAYEETSQALTALRVVLTSQGELTHQELDSLGQRFFDQLKERFNEQIAALDFPQGAAGGCPLVRAPADDAPSGFRAMRIGEFRRLGVRITVSDPGSAVAEAGFRVFVASGGDEDRTLMIEAENDSLVFALRDVHPQISALTEHRLNTLVDRTLRRLLAQVVPTARQSAMESGYLFED